MRPEHSASSGLGRTAVLGREPGGAAMGPPQPAGRPRPHDRARRIPRLGFPVVLTADRSLMAGYDVLFGGMVSVSQTTRTPAALMRLLLAPRVPHTSRRAHAAPLGLRRLEAALVAGGWSPDDVAVVPPEELGRAVGPATRVVGVSSGDPLGIGMNSTTMTAITGGRTHTARWFQRLMARICGLRATAPGARVVVGGPGAWQLAQDEDARARLGVDHLVCGYCEGNVAELFRSLADGDRLDPVIAGVGVPVRDVPAVLGPALMGAVEISRGCGLGCTFCTIGRMPMEHLSVDTILADASVNLAGGQSCLSIVSEDVLRYGAEGRRVRPQEVIGLLRRMRALPGVELIQADHANISSVGRFSDSELREVRGLLAGRDDPGDFIWLNLGVETASGPLLAANGGSPKMHPYGPDDWAEACSEQLERLCKAGIFPLVSLMLGLPGETRADLARTLRWVEGLAGRRVAVFPMFFAPVGGADGPGSEPATPEHWRIMQLAYGLNFRWIPRLMWNNQSRGCVPLWRRLSIQGLGRLSAPWWQALFAWRARGAFA